jgi:serine protease Do
MIGAKLELSGAMTMSHQSMGLLLAAWVLWTFAGCPAADAKIYKYQRQDGTWVFTDNASEVPATGEMMKETGAAAPQAGGRDLEQLLTQRLRPRNAIERASMATLVVESPIGRGSGFFISADGYILTNKHVIRTPEGNTQALRQKIKTIDAKIDRIEKDLEDEQARLAARRRELKKIKTRMSSAAYRNRSGQLDRWQDDIDKRRAAFQKDVWAYRRKKRKVQSQSGMDNLSKSFTVTLADKSKRYVYLVALSERYDLALLKLDGHRTPRLEPDAPYATPVGERVFAIGNPIRLHNSVAAGVLSGYEGAYLKTDARIYPGNSGGPLVSEAGRVLGINTFKALTRNFEGLGFAIPVHTALAEFKTYLAR